MAFQHVVLPRHHLAVVTFYGSVKGSDICAAIRAVYTDPDWCPGYGKLVDARRVESLDVSPADLRRVAESGDERLAGAGGLAVVQCNWLVRAIAGLGLRAMPFRRPVAVFEALEPALAWLGISGAVEAELGGAYV